jgi:hypothetical protein
MKDTETSYQSISKLFYRTIALVILTSLFSSYSVFAADKETGKPGASTSEGTATEQYSPEEKQLRMDWDQSMLQKPAPKKGCFRATYPDKEWKEVPCVTVPNIPFMPREGARPFVIGGGNSISAEAPSGTITTAIGRFENITNVTSETGAGVSNAYSLQINTDFMTSPACAASPNPGCRGWEQWVYYNSGSSGMAFIQYWLIQYNTTCPTGWNSFSFPPPSTDTYCWRNNTAGGVGVPNQPIANMGNWRLSGTVTATGDSVTMTTLGGAYTQSGDNFVSAAANWTSAEFNIFGPGNGAQAVFNAGASVDARTQIFYGGSTAPNCLADGTTGETNNLSFGPLPPAATAPGPALIFTESIAGGSPTTCGAAVTIGDTHLHTFNGLFYDFQASGDFSLAKVAPDFEVQTRQKSGAPTWPNASVNKAVAARFGDTQVAICLAPSNVSATAARVLVNGTPTTVNDGQILELPGNTAMRRLGNVYQVVGEHGNSISATVNSYSSNSWINVSVGLGRWPSTVKGLIANANGNVNQIATRDGSVLTTPFNFDDLYHRFGDSWRVSSKESMLSACDKETPVEVASPTKIFYAKDLKPDVREKALAVCNAAGVKPGPLLDACTLDVAVIGEDAAAKVFTTRPTPIAVGTIVTTGPGLLGLPWWLWILLLIILLIILWWLIRRGR